jgi:hypothetical protein
LNRKSHYPKFIGLSCDAWIDIEHGNELKVPIRGWNNYTRRGEELFLKEIKNPKTNGYVLYKYD